MSSKELIIDAGHFPDGITLSVYNSGGLDDSTTLSINTLTEIDNISSA
ncbi:MAG: hypothetical protein GY869_25210, partial [Planctomycetes bacterium]|nr:hypothetical protein [Planctomycetota bacterium]